MENTRKSYNLIDVVKIIMAVFVVAIHRPIFSESMSSYNDFLNTFFYSTAVPFFMIVSSFMFFQNCSKYDNQRTYLIKQEKRLIFLYCFWSVVYIPRTLITSIMKVQEKITLSIILKEFLIWIKNFFTYSTIAHLWYVNTLIVCIFILYFLRKKLKPETILVICIVLSVITGLILSSVTPYEFRHNVYKTVPYLLIYTLRKGLICCAFGLYVADRKKNLSNIKSAVLFISVTAVEIVLFALAESSKEFSESYLTFLFGSLKALSVFMICKNVEIKDSPVFVRLRSYSSLIYFTHLLLSGSLLSRILHFYPLYYLPAKFGKFALAILFSFTVSFIIYRLSRIEKLRFLRRIY